MIYSNILKIKLVLLLTHYYIHVHHLQVIHKYYDKMNAVKGHDQKIDFKEDSIGLDIPFPSEEGITTVNGGWRITAVSAPVVSYAIAKYVWVTSLSYSIMIIAALPRIFSRQCVLVEMTDHIKVLDSEIKRELLAN